MLKEAVTIFGTKNINLKKDYLLQGGLHHHIPEDATLIHSTFISH